MKQTAVEWIVSKLSITFQTMYSQEIEQANEMFNEQIKEAWIEGGGYSRLSEENDKMLAEKYYNETYGDK
jgi:hypothetical protein